MQKPHTLADVIVQTYKYHKTHPQQRFGQALYNYIYTIDEHLALALINNDLDPFYDESKLPQIYAFIQKWMSD